MNKEDICKLISNKIKLIRVENGYSQDKMSDIIGISKKTLIQIEKGRDYASWGVVVTTCALFRESEILQSTFGDEPLEILSTIAHDKIDSPKEKTMGGKIWWIEVQKEGSLILQQNVISKHYRILDKDGYRWFSSFDKDESLTRLIELKDIP